MRVPLGVLDQSPVISGHSPAGAIAETVSLARLAEELGYHRYWLAEHHAIAALADPSPEILVSRVACATSRIRVGTGGVLLPYYRDRKSTRLNSSHTVISYAVFCLKKKKKKPKKTAQQSTTLPP